MAKYVLKVGVGVVLVSAILYQTIIRDLLFNLAGIGRVMQPIDAFPYECRRITDTRLQACEDMWLSESTRQLFLACSDSLSRRDWMPNIGRVNVSGRGLDDAVIAMDIDSPNGQGFNYRVLKTPGFGGVNGDGRLHLVGMTGIDNTEEIELFLVNAQPSIDLITGQVLNHNVHGGNSTIERFSTRPRATSMKHLRTYSHAQIATPNNIAVSSRDSFYITNDHGLNKVGPLHTLSPYLATGDITHCTSTICTRVSSSHRFPNGLLQSHHPSHPNMLYVPSTGGRGGISVYHTAPDSNLTYTTHIPIPYAIDNLSQDSKGEIYAPAFPKALQMLDGFNDPMHARAPTAVFRIRITGAHGEYRYTWEKILEDREGEVLPSATAVVHDARTGRLFLSGVWAPWIAVCEPRS